MAKRKRRTSIRTAAGTTQQRFLERLRALKEDPLIVLPDCPDGEPKPIAKLHQALDKVAAGKVGFRAKRDKGVLGAVVSSIQLSELDSVPRLMDTKVAGKRRFFLTRGHLQRGAVIGVQNHDEPRALLMAYRTMAQQEGLHFFARPGLVCTGEKPLPPEPWLEDIAQRARLPLHSTPDGHALGGIDGARVRLRFGGGPCLDNDGGSEENVHQLVAAGYAGPGERHPVEVRVVLPDGSETEPERELAASYRAGVASDRELLEATVAHWRKETRRSGGTHFVLDDRDFAGDQDAFIDALEPEPWERPVLERLTRNGFVGQGRSTADVFHLMRDDLPEALQEDLDDAAQFVAARQKTPAREIVRQALDEAAARQRLAQLPAIQGGRETRFVDNVARAAVRSKRSAMDVLHAGLDSGAAPAGHIAAFAQALGGDLNLNNRLDADARATGEALAGAAAAVLQASGSDYVVAVDAFLREAGSSDRAQAA